MYNRMVEEGVPTSWRLYLHAGWTAALRAPRVCSVAGVVLEVVDGPVHHPSLLQRGCPALEPLAPGSHPRTGLEVAALPLKTYRRIK